MRTKLFPRICSAICFALSLVSTAHSVVVESYIAENPVTGSFPLSVNGKSAVIVVSDEDFAGVQRVAKDLQTDIGLVTDAKPDSTNELPSKSKFVVVVGTIGKSPLIDELVRTGKLSVAGVAGRWEASVTQAIENPWPNVEQALVIAGSDKRGTIFGMYELSAQIGVSPWVWWADVPPRKKEAVHVLPGRHVLGEPAVKYRGIFLNDEAPALAGWAQEKFGGCNSKFYVHVYELILRMKGNYLWPAMWGRSLYDDDPLSPKLADEYGVVIGTSHHEPMMRAHVEWERYGEGDWNYGTNPEKLREFWREGIERMGTNESVVTLAMRGDGDEPMSAEANTALLEKIVADQRKILAEVTGKPLESQPQVWALYKEVQEYYDKGMRVPDDVTLLLCDDNWGNIRKLPNIKDKPRAGGYGIYYHFDYVGGPRNYKWLNTTQVSRVWEQMHLAYRHGVDRLWIVNVGDLKPMEYPIEFFLDYAWDPEAWPAERLPEYATRWAGEQFGDKHAEEIAELITAYTTINSRRKPELLSPETYSLVNYNEWERVSAEYNALAARAGVLAQQIPAEQRDAYFQLVLFPIQACANLNEMYYTTARNHLSAEQGGAETNKLAERVRELYARDAELCRQYNEDLAHGKWRHMMDQTHIGYTYWQQPDVQVMPEVKEIEIPADAKTKEENASAESESTDHGAPAAEGMLGFIESDNCVSIDAEHYTKAVGTGLIRWERIPDLGRNVSGSMATFPVTVEPQTPGGESPHLEYKVHLFNAGNVKVKAYLSPTLDFKNDGGLECAISFDDEDPKRVNLHPDTSVPAWEAMVAANINVVATGQAIEQPGEHTLKFWMIDPGVVVERLVIETGDVRPSYLGPPESRFLP